VNACVKQDCVSGIKAVAGDGRIKEPTALRINDELFGADVELAVEHVKAHGALIVSRG
jgi:hypothetical protein